jgi:iron-sulfur cluster repair protein YtfE (RIC family)
MSVNDLPGTSAARYGPGDRLIAMSASHNAFRRDMQKMAVVATPANLRNPARYQSIQNGWQIFKRQLLIHHAHEDRFLWPRLRQRVATSEAAMSMLDEMDAEHSLIDPLLAGVDEGFERPEQVDVGAMIDELTSKLSFHLDHEEREAMPLIGEVLSDKEWNGIVRNIRKATKLSSAAEFMPWLTDGTTSDQAKTIVSIMPPPARVVVRRVWQPKYRKVSHW